MDNWIYLVLAYSVAWIAILFYVFLNSQKQTDLEYKIRDIESMLAQKD
jgi:CcmD family protein